MSNHPIEGLMLTTMNSLKDMIDVNTIIGDPIQTPNNTVVIPISKVSFGFAAGGSEFNGETPDNYRKTEKDEQIQYRLPFGGGAGAGVSVNPVAFLVIQNDFVKLLPVNHNTSIEKILDYIPDLFEKASCIINKSMQNKKEQTDSIINKIKKNCNKEKDEINKKNEKADKEEVVEKTEMTTKIEVNEIEDVE